MDAELAEFMADSQVPWGLEAAGGTISEPAWRSKSSWYLVTTDDRMIPPSLQREMSAEIAHHVKIRVELDLPLEMFVGEWHQGDPLGLQGFLRHEVRKIAGGHRVQ